MPVYRPYFCQNDARLFTKMSPSEELGTLVCGWGMNCFGCIIVATFYWEELHILGIGNCLVLSYLVTLDGWNIQNERDARTRSTSCTSSCWGAMRPKSLCGRQAAPWLCATQLLCPGFVHPSVLHIYYKRATLSWHLNWRRRVHFITFLLLLSTLYLSVSVCLCLFL